MGMGCISHEPMRFVRKTIFRSVVDVSSSERCFLWSMGDFSHDSDFRSFFWVHWNDGASPLFSGNDSKVDGLVNFEKLRMIAKEIRHVGRMASVNMDPALMFRTRCADPMHRPLVTPCVCYISHYLVSKFNSIEIVSDSLSCCALTSLLQGWLVLNASECSGPGIL